MKVITKKLIATLLVLSCLLCMWQPTEVQAAKKEPKLSQTSIAVSEFDRGRCFKLKVYDATTIPKWTYDDEYLSMIEDSGATASFEAKKAGNTTVKCKVGKKTLTCKITIYNVLKAQDVELSYTSKKIGKNVYKFVVNNKSKISKQVTCYVPVYDKDWNEAGDKASTVNIPPNTKKAIYVTGLANYNLGKPGVYGGIVPSYYKRDEYLVNIPKEKIKVDISNISYSENTTTILGTSWDYTIHYNIDFTLKNKMNFPIVVSYRFMAYKKDKLYAVTNVYKKSCGSKDNMSAHDEEYLSASFGNVRHDEVMFHTLSGKDFSDKDVTYKVEIIGAEYDYDEF